MSKMENWREKIKVGDISEASRRTGINQSTYHISKNKTPEKWTKSQRAINLAIKRIIEEREAEIALLTGNDQSKC